ncbi:hypothetical protein [Arthrobacter sp. SO3]|uniref:hypothetical protein n=1 Tax=Arthrobacter sp. SO3 TaxID=1897057 RepID=UPI001CFF80F9|nr:hypothetical protein [Arthrobacter sp. SO3]MCB5292028.1 hypothetical protein [Arthrobacter sp. SO3]
MNAIHPSNDADLPESVPPTLSAEPRKLKSWELRDYVAEYQTYSSPGAAHIAARLASRYNSKKGYSYETQRQIADATGYTRNAVAQYLKELEATGLWTFVHGKPGTATRYAPVATELSRAKKFIDFRLAGRLSALPFPKVPNFRRPTKQAGLTGFAKVSSDAKKARDIREAAEAAILEPAAAENNTSATETEYEISAYTPDDMPDFGFPEEPVDDYAAPLDTSDPYMPRPLVEAAEHSATLTTTTSRPVVVIDDGCPF